jgi:hypothetical protein
MQDPNDSAPAQLILDGEYISILVLPHVASRV